MTAEPLHRQLEWKAVATHWKSVAAQYEAEIASLRAALAKCREETVAECAKVADEFADNLGSRHTEYAKLAERIRALASTGRGAMSEPQVRKD